MKRFFLVLSLFIPIHLFADTIDHYIHISNSIPTMEMKADADAQAWARSAKNVLIITNESIAETLLEANRLAQNQAKPLFCLPQNVKLDAATLKTLIEETYNKLPGTQTDKDKMTVSQIASLAVTQHYPCQTRLSALNALPGITTMQHEEG